MRIILHCKDSSYAKGVIVKNRLFDSAREEFFGCFACKLSEVLNEVGLVKITGRVTQFGQVFAFAVVVQRCLEADYGREFFRCGAHYFPESFLERALANI